MRKIGLALMVCLISSACSYQRPIVIKEPGTPRMIVKEAQGIEKKTEEKKEYFESSSQYPDLTRGYIENDAYPYRAKVWLLTESGKRVFLIGHKNGPPDFSLGSIREFNLPPGKHILHIERWQYFANYGGWRPVSKIEVIKLEVGQFEPKRWRYWADSHYGWWVIVHQDRTTVYSGYLDYY